MNNVIVIITCTYYLLILIFYIEIYGRLSLYKILTIYITIVHMLIYCLVLTLSVPSHVLFFILSKRQAPREE